MSEESPRTSLRASVVRHRSMARDYAFQTASEGLRMMVALVSFAILGRELEVEHYGAYLGTYGVIGPVGALLVGGLGLAVMQRVLREQEDLSEVVSRYLTVVFLASVPGVVLVSVVAASLIDQMPMLAIVSITFSELTLAGIVWIGAEATHAAVGLASAVWVRVSSAVVRMLGLVTVFALDMVSLTSVAVSTLITLVLVAAFVLFYWLPRIGAHYRPMRPTRAALATGAQLGAGTIAASVQDDTDKTVLNAYGLERDAGLYGAAYKVISLAMIPLAALNGATFRRFLTDDSSVRGLHVRRSLNYSKISLPLSALISVGVWVFAPLLNVIVGDGFDESVTMIRWLCLYLPVRALASAPLNGLLGLGRVGARLVALVAASITSLSLYVILIPTHSWAGAIGATIAAEALLLVLTWGMLFHYQGVADRRHDAADPMSSPRADRSKRVLAIASSGGHWVQLQRVQEAFAGHEVLFASVRPEDAASVAPSRYVAIPDATRWSKVAVVRSALAIAWLLLRFRPDVVVSTGAAPGYLAIRLGRLLGARTVWIDSIANAAELSMSGRRIGPYADLWLTQWEHLAAPDGPTYLGEVV